MIGPMVGLGGSDYTPIPIKMESDQEYTNSYTLTISSNSAANYYFYLNDETISIGDTFYIEIKRTDNTTGKRLIGSNNYINIYTISSSNYPIGVCYAINNNNVYVKLTDSSSSYIMVVSNFSLSNKKISIKSVGGTSSSAYTAIGTYSVQVYKLKYPNNNKLLS